MGFLPGLGGVIGVPSTLELFASVTSSASTITVPAGVADGDVAVLIDRGSNSSGLPTAVTPSGYALRANVVGTSFLRAMISTKILSSGDAGATVTGMNASGSNRKVMLVIRRAPTVTAVSASAVTSTTAGSSNPSPAAASYAGMTGSSLTLGVLACPTVPTVTGAAFSPTATGSVTSDSKLLVYYLLTASGDPGSCSVDQGDSGGNDHINVLLNLEVT